MIRNGQIITRSAPRFRSVFGHPVLSMCVSHTVIALDDASNRKPSKRRSTAKIYGLVAVRVVTPQKSLLQISESPGRIQRNAP
jgi:hypothetical protein